MAVQLYNVCVFCENGNPLVIHENLVQMAKDLPVQISYLDPAKSTGKESELQNAEILISEPHLARIWLYGLPKLKLVLGIWAGVESVLQYIDPVKLPVITYCRFAGGGGYGQMIPEYVVAQVISYERNFRFAYKKQEQRQWVKEVGYQMMSNSRSLDELTIGILGLGDTGKLVSKACRAFGMTVWGVVNTIPSDESQRQHADHYRTSSDLEEVLSNCDYICNILPSTHSTQGLLDSCMFRHCQSRRSVFINIGRGNICTEESILEALNEGWLRAAILDVFTKEPLDSSSPLWTHPNVTITPHISSGYKPHLFNCDLFWSENSYLDQDFKPHALRLSYLATV